MVPDVSVLSQYKILVTTLVTAHLLVLMGLPKGHFTHIFVDEAAQVYIAAYITMYVYICTKELKLYKLKISVFENIHHFMF